MPQRVLTWSDIPSGIIVNGVYIELNHRCAISYDHLTDIFRLTTTTKICDHTFMVNRDVTSKDMPYYAIESAEMAKLVNREAYLFMVMNPGEFANFLMGCDNPTEEDLVAEDAFDYLDAEDDDDFEGPYDGSEWQ